MARKPKNDLPLPSDVVKVTLVPETPIIAPVVTREQVERWIKRGWVPEDYVHVDRAFPRNSEGRPIMFKHWFEAPMKDACEVLGYPARVARDWDIVDENGLPVGYVVIPEKPLVYKRAILAETRSLEVYEYIDGTYTLEFYAKVNTNVQQWAEALILAGKIGMMSRTRRGYGKFRVQLGVKA